MNRRYYEIHILIPAVSATDWVTLEGELIGSGELIRGGPGQVGFVGYPFRFLLQEGPEAMQANAELARNLGMETTDFPQCLTFFGEQPDGDMDHFNDAVLLMERLETLLPGAVLTQDGVQV